MNGRPQAAIGIQSMAALEVFDRIHQRPTVGLLSVERVASADRSPTSRKKRTRRGTPA
jgi:hypothetical protein